jgi:hypothetical protein
MRGDAAQLPIRVPPKEWESGLGYLLRALSINGSTLLAARQQCGIRDWRSLTHEQLRELAYLTAVDSDWLGKRIMLRSMQTPEHFEFFLQSFRCQAAPPNMGAKVCPECIRESGCCHRTWILPAAIVCPDHARPFIDTCGRCLRLITWRRPAVDVCTCGRYLTDRELGGKQRPPNCTEDWTRWLDARLDPEHPTWQLANTAMPRLLDCLSIDGATAVVLAFGVIEAPERMTPLRQSREPLDRLLGTIERGIERLGTIDGAPHEARRWSAHVYSPILERLKRTGVTTSDRDCAALLLRYVGHRSPRSKGGRYNLGQMELFDR